MIRIPLLVLFSLAACKSPLPEGVTVRHDGVHVQGWDDSEIVLPRRVWDQIADSLRAHSERSGVPISSYWGEISSLGGVPPPPPPEPGEVWEDEEWEDIFAELERQLADAPVFPFLVFANSARDRELLEEARRRELIGDTSPVPVPVGYGSLYFKLAADTSAVIGVEIHNIRR